MKENKGGKIVGLIVEKVEEEANKVVEEKTELKKATKKSNTKN